MTESDTNPSNGDLAPKQPSTPSPELSRLDVFVGTWNMEGQQHESPIGPAAKITAWRPVRT